jgi:hypothetical protein
MASTGLQSETARDKLPTAARSKQAARLVSLDGFQTRTGESFRLKVEERVPRFISPRAPARTTAVDSLDEVLGVPWISKLPGNKRLRRFRGQMIVVQHYLGHRLVRACVQWDCSPADRPERSMTLLRRKASPTSRI